MRRIGCVVLIAVAVLVIGSLFLGRGPKVEPGSTLVIELAGAYREAPETPLLQRLAGRSARPFVGLLSDLRKAERDERISAVVLRIRDLQIGWGKAQELRDALAALAEAGKRTLAYLEVEALSANLEYYVATGAAGVHMSPATTAPVVGLAAEYLFLGGLWEKFGIELEVERVGRYKSAADFLAGREMSEAHREMAEALLDSLDAQFVAGISEGRGLPESRVRSALDTAPARADELLELGLIDAISHFDELKDALDDAPQIEAEDYAGVSLSDLGFDPKARVALVYGSGAVVVGKGSSSPAGSPLLASDTVSKALEEAAEDDSIDAVLFRIDSPGGSALASDTVWRATQKLKQAGKPFVVSMSDVAASGGYYVACAADFVYADAGTLTGSIGVFLLRPVLGRLYEKLDIGSEGLTRGAHADLLLASRPLSPESRERLREEVVSIYDLFVERVAEGRRLPRSKVDELGRGRVWTGAQAAERGLVDGVGGLRVAAKRLRQELALDADADLELVTFPRPRSLAEQVEDLLRGAVVRAALPDPAGDLARRLEPWLAAAASGAPALLPPLVVEIR